jgi:hypothetical protein
VAPRGEKAKEVVRFGDTSHPGTRLSPSDTWQESLLPVSGAMTGRTKLASGTPDPGRALCPNQTEAQIPKNEFHRTGHGLLGTVLA